MLSLESPVSLGVSCIGTGVYRGKGYSPGLVSPKGHRYSHGYPSSQTLIAHSTPCTGLGVHVPVQEIHSLIAGTLWMVLYEW